MTHEEALNLMLASQCRSVHEEDGDVQTFEFELHCVRFEIKAILSSTVDTIQYEILSANVEEY